MTIEKSSLYSVGFKKLELKNVTIRQYKRNFKLASITHHVSDYLRLETDQGFC